MYFLKTGSPAQLQWLRIFEPLMVITGIVQPLATIPSISKLYFTHSRHASGQSLTTWSIFAIASLLWVTYGLLNRKPAIYVGNIIGLVMNFTDGQWHPDECRMDLLRFRQFRHPPPRTAIKSSVIVKEGKQGSSKGVTPRSWLRARLIRRSPMSS